MPEKPFVIEIPHKRLVVFVNKDHDLAPGLFMGCRNDVAESDGKIVAVELHTIPVFPDLKAIVEMRVQQSGFFILQWIQVEVQHGILLPAPGVGVDVRSLAIECYQVEICMSRKKNSSALLNLEMRTLLKNG